ncbi:MAG: hypothetical protein EBR74_11185 [Flavobacteriia bacterium]|nr:hypothetical protein [Flavobacteriia bacterium]
MSSVNQIVEMINALPAEEREFVVVELRKSLSKDETPQSKTLDKKVPSVFPSLPSLPCHLVSEIVGLANGTNKTDPLVIEIHPETGAQTAELNSHILAPLKELVKEAVELLKKHHQVFELTQEIDEDDFEFDEEIETAIKEYSKNVQPLDKITIRSAYAHYGIKGFDDLNDPISKAFYKKAYGIAKQLKPLSSTLRVQYLDKALTQIHLENSDLSFAIQFFVWNYAHSDSLVKDFVSPLNCKRFDSDEYGYEPILDYDGEASNLDVLKWASRNNQREWLKIVSGKIENEAE